MFGYSKIRSWLVIVGIVFGILFALPNIIPSRVYDNLFPKAKEIFHPITLGLDLRGGSYLLMEVDTQELIQDKLTNLSDSIRSEFRSKRILFSGLRVENETLTLKILHKEDIQSAKELLRSLDDTPLDLQQQDQELIVSYQPQALDELKQKIVSESVEIVRKRIDELGTKEPQIQRQGTDRIVIQLPGVQDPSEIKALLGKTAKMTFHLVNEEVSAADAQMGKLPVDSMLATGDETGYIVLKRAVVVGGESLKDARNSYDQDGHPAVSFTFNNKGAKKFATATRENVNKRLAIILDGNVISAPVINSPITGGQGIITGNFSVESAHDLALMLRSGALPAPLRVIEERVVGAGLGDDSIKAGERACLFGLISVAIFMIFVYGKFGIIADLVLCVNGLLLVGLLGLLNATLTLPGIAGIALTLGMAVDANVIVFERMKEEKRKGVTHPKEIIKAGFANSFSAILDGQLTSLFAALFLFWLGSGPVRGFGVTLGLGLATTMFCATCVTQFFMMIWLHFSTKKEIKI